MYQPCAAQADTICGICGVFAVTLIWIVQSYLQLFLCPVISIIAIHLLNGITDADLSKLQHGAGIV